MTNDTTNTQENPNLDEEKDLNEGNDANQETVEGSSDEKVEENKEPKKTTKKKTEKPKKTTKKKTEKPDEDDEPKRNPILAMTKGVDVNVTSEEKAIFQKIREFHGYDMLQMRDLIEDEQLIEELKISKKTASVLERVIANFEIQSTKKIDLVDMERDAPEVYKIFEHTGLHASDLADPKRFEKLVKKEKDRELVQDYIHSIIYV